jgi:hypothetical protein
MNLLRKSTTVLFFFLYCIAPTHSATNSTASQSFDFLIGEWSVHHRYLRVQGDQQEWLETDGTCSNHQLMDGFVNIDECTINAPSGVNQAIALRSFDIKTKQWAIWWLDGRYPSGPLDPPLKGSFDNGIGTFYSEFLEKEKRMRMRFIWSKITSTAAHWEQATSSDNGKIWETNWIMEFQRKPTNQASTHDSARVTKVTQPSARADFDFLEGEWRVRHHRFQPDRNKWVDFDGTCRNHKIMNGSANIEEHKLNSPNGAYHAIGLRSYNAKTQEWAIWWLDGRYPSGPIDPPVTGKFEDGVGKFYSNYMDKGKPMRVRFLWSQITPTSARWEQSTSDDDGKTWKANWIMEFQRVS